MLSPTEGGENVFEDGYVHDKEGKEGNISEYTTKSAEVDALSDVEDLWIAIPPPYENEFEESWESEGSGESSPTLANASQEDLIQLENTAWVKTREFVKRNRPRSVTIAQLLESENTAFIVNELRAIKTRRRSSTTIAERLESENLAWVHTRRVVQSTRARASTVSHTRAETLDSDNHSWDYGKPDEGHESFFDKAKAHLSSLSPTSPYFRFSYQSHARYAAQSSDFLDVDNTAWLFADRQPRAGRPRASTVSHLRAETLESENRSYEFKPSKGEHEGIHSRSMDHLQLASPSSKRSQRLPRLRIPSAHFSGSRSSRSSPRSSISEASQTLTANSINGEELLEPDIKPASSPNRRHSFTHMVLGKKGRRATISFSADEVAALKE